MAFQSYSCYWTVIDTANILTRYQQGNNLASHFPPQKTLQNGPYKKKKRRIKRRNTEKQKKTPLLSQLKIN